MAKLTIPALICVLLAAGANAAVFEEHFNDLSKWTVAEPNAWPGQVNPYVDSTLFPNEVTKPYLVLPYRSMYASLGDAPISTFKMKWKWLHGYHKGANNFIFLLNSAGTQGYCVRWISPATGPGYVAIGKWTDPNKPGRGNATRAGSFVNLLASSMYITGDSVIAPFADFEFARDASGKLTLSVTDGTHGYNTTSIYNNLYSSFSQIAIVSVGDSTQGFLADQYVDELIVRTFEEPGSCGEAASKGYLLAADINSDCHVTLADLALMMNSWMRCNDPANSNCERTW